MDTRIIGFIGFILFIVIFYILPLFSKKEVESRIITKEIKRKELERQKVQEKKIAAEMEEERRIKKQVVIEQQIKENQLKIKRYQDLRQQIEQMPIYKRWKDDVIKRCRNKCQMCGIINNLEVHHRDSFYSIIKMFKITTTGQAFECKELWDISNGEVLCKECHDRMESSKKAKELNNNL